MSDNHQRVDIRNLPPISQETLLRHYEIRERELVRHIELMRWKLDALKEWADAMINESNSPQYGHDVRTLLEVSSMDEARDIDAL